MRRWRRYGVAGLGVWGMFVLVQLGGLLLATPLADAGLDVGGEPGDPRIGIAFVVGLLFATVIVYAAFHFEFQWLVRGLLFVVSAGMTWFVFATTIPPVVSIRGINAPAAALALILVVATFRYQEWWLIDLQAIVLGMGIVALFGISFGVLPILLLLVLLAVYDAISVYGTKHMLTMAEDAVASGLPVLLVVPLSRGGASETTDTDEGAWGDAIYIGLGDAAIPAILVVSAVVHAPVEGFVLAGLAVTVPAISTMLGIGCGLAGLLSLTATGRAHAGLPLLNAGAILGYLVGAWAVGVGPVEAAGMAGFR